jgi:3-oxoacyl-[acyl-carrier protein] reductase
VTVVNDDAIESEDLLDLRGSAAYRGRHRTADAGLFALGGRLGLQYVKVAKTAVITGVGRRRGIGAGLAAGLATDGWNLALSFWRPYDERIGLEGSGDDPQSLADELSALGVQVELLPMDLSDPSRPERLIELAAERFGSVDALVMSHCESVDSSLLTTSVDSFDRHYAVNVRATWLLTAAFARHLPASGGSCRLPP